MSDDFCICHVIERAERRDMEPEPEWDRPTPEDIYRDEREMAENRRRRRQQRGEDALSELWS